MDDFKNDKELKSSDLPKTGIKLTVIFQVGGHFLEDFIVRSILSLKETHHKSLLLLKRLNKIKLNSTFYCSVRKDWKPSLPNSAVVS